MDPSRPDEWPKTATQCVSIVGSLQGEMIAELRIAVHTPPQGTAVAAVAVQSESTTWTSLGSMTLPGPPRSFVMTTHLPAILGSSPDPLVSCRPLNGGAIPTLLIKKKRGEWLLRILMPDRAPQDIPLPFMQIVDIHSYMNQ